MPFNPSEHMIKLKGKDYLQVMWRLCWFREEKPGWCIDTQLVSHEGDNAVFCAKILDEEGVMKSSGYGSESKRDFADYLEKAETKAVGRALAMLGYGTQFAPDLDEGERIVDSPVQREPVKGTDLPTYTPKKATKAQLKQIQEAAGGDIELVKHVLGLFGYQSSKDVEGEKVQAILGTIRQKVGA